MALGDEVPRSGPNAVVAATSLGGAAAATAGAIWSARAIARRNGAPLNPVMKTAATACELAHSPSALEEERKA